MTSSFNKPPTTYQEQVQILRKRGMVIPSEPDAEFYLQHLNYYRLGAYWLPFESNHQSHEFHQNTSFDNVLGLYIFDRELRLLLLPTI